MDPISDMLTRIRNSQMVSKEDVIIPCSNFKLKIAELLEKEGYIGNCEKIDDQGRSFIRLLLKYHKGKGVINKIERISKPGQRIYAGKDEIPYVLQGLGTLIISTSQGLMTGKDAKKKGLGGELVCRIW